MEIENKPYVPFGNLEKCGAKTRGGEPCKGVAMRNGRCRLHGGKSTGPKTPEGRARCGNWKHGRYSKLEIERRRMINQLCKEVRNNVCLVS